jgi:hypothetical protein
MLGVLAEAVNRLETMYIDLVRDANLQPLWPDTMSPRGFHITHVKIIRLILSLW